MGAYNGNFPDTTFGGDPRAPWNQPDYPTCEECGEPLEYNRYGELFCPNCRIREENEEVDE